MRTSLSTLLSIGFVFIGVPATMTLFDSDATFTSFGHPVSPWLGVAVALAMLMAARRVRPETGGHRAPDARG